MERGPLELHVGGMGLCECAGVAVCRSVCVYTKIHLEGPIKIYKSQLRVKVSHCWVGMAYIRQNAMEVYRIYLHDRTILDASYMFRQRNISSRYQTSYQSRVDT